VINFQPPPVTHRGGDALPPVSRSSLQTQRRNYCGRNQKYVIIFALCIASRGKKTSHAPENDNDSNLDKAEEREPVVGLVGSIGG